MDLKNKVVLITGAGSGIGRCTAELFAEKGAFVAVNDVNQNAGEETVSNIRQKNGNSKFYCGDVTNSEEIKKVVEAIIKDYARIDVLFNNAGISGVGELHELNEGDWDKVTNVNIKGVFLTSKYVLNYMMRQQSGSIINMSSCVAEIGLQKRALYAATKGAVLSMTKSMQVDYAKHNIRVNALLPGTIYTPFVEKYLKESYDDPDKALASITQRQLTDNLGKPEDVAKAALFLASDQSSFVMGSPLYVDGGVVFGKDA